MEDPWAAPPRGRVGDDQADGHRAARDRRSASSRACPSRSTASRCRCTSSIVELNDDRRRLRLGPPRHGREPPGRHQEPRDLRVPGAPGADPGPPDLESITLERDLAREKPRLEPRYAELVYDGLWFSPLKQALDAFVDASQRFVTGEVRLRLEPGRCYVVGRRSDAQPLRLRPGHLRRRRHASATRTPRASCGCGASASQTWAAAPGPAERAEPS